MLKNRKTQKFRLIDGVEHKQCTGKYGCCDWFPKDSFYKSEKAYKKQNGSLTYHMSYYSTCRACTAIYKANHQRTTRNSHNRNNTLLKGQNRHLVKVRGTELQVLFEPPTIPWTPAPARILTGMFGI